MINTGQNKKQEEVWSETDSSQAGEILLRQETGRRGRGDEKREEMRREIKMC